MVRIIDASVAVKWFVIEEGRDAALRVLSQLLDDPSAFAVPELFYFELAHVFPRVLPRPTEEEMQLLQLLVGIGVHRFSMTADLLAAMRRYQETGLSGYDSAYVALAERLRGRWLTFDARAHSRVASTGLSELLE